MFEEKFEFTSGLKKKVLYAGIAGIVLLIIGIITINLGGHGAGHGGGEEHGHAFHWTDRLWTNFWINNLYFTGIALLGVFFVAVNYAAQAGWSAGIKRIPEAFGAWLPIAGILMLGIFLIANHTIFHWTHEEVVAHDPILQGKQAYLNIPFFVIRMVVFFLLWILLYRVIRKKSLEEDEKGGLNYYKVLRKYSAIFIIIFAVTSSVAAWDWGMSIDPHWFSTIYGWYYFASWFVAGLSAITLFVIFIKEAGYLKIVNENHYHDLGKYVFAFSVFWMYIWFSQYFLIYYSNIPEEAIYYVERMKSGIYGKYFYLNIIINFFFPFLVLMTRDSKRHGIFLKIACVVLLAGHWLDFFLMVTPGILKDNGGLGFMEVGMLMIYGSAFTYVVLNQLSKASLIAKNHPMLQESAHMHV